MNVYLDASVIIAILTNDVFTARADAYLRAEAPILIVSDFAGAEFASALSRRVRMREVDAHTARTILAEFDVWTARSTEHAETTGADVLAAARALRRLDLTLRTADAINIAIAQRVGAILMPFDNRMAALAKALGIEIAPT